MQPFSIHAEIRRAETPPAEFYHRPEWFELCRERVLPAGRHFIGDANLPAGHARPEIVQPGLLDEAVAVTRDGAGRLRVISNVCTHRGHLVVLDEGPLESLRCRYHGRRFSLDGSFRSMPCFDDVEDHPRPDDDLRYFEHTEWGPLLFVHTMPVSRDWIADLARLPIPPDRLQPDPARTRDYHVDANWALYVDNYLEGFHIPFVHPELDRTLDPGDYRTELLGDGVLQLGLARPGEPTFPGPEPIAAYYFWFFPNLMLNFYPWGLSLNRVDPLGPTRTRIHYREYVWDESARGTGAGGDLDTVELEDQAVIERAQLGVRSTVYHRGRYSPTRETGVHHFHRLLTDRLFAGG